MRKVFGHLNPDTDSVCSPIAYAWFATERRGIPTTPYLLGEPSREAAYVLKRFNQAIPELLGALSEADEVVLVDTNNPEELPSDLSVATVKEIVDHHKFVGGISTSEPISVTLRPLACTATLLWQIMQQEGVTGLPENIAGLMVSAIISDTLKFTSPTTTDADKLAAEQLAGIAGISIDELAGGMFEAKSDLAGMSAEDLLVSDSKVFGDLGGKKVRVSSLETTKPANALAMKDELAKAMEEMKLRDGLDGVFFFVVDILESNATMIAPSDFERQVAERGFGVTFDSGTAFLPGVVSRKKQIIPVLEKALAE